MIALSLSRSVKMIDSLLLYTLEDLHIEGDGHGHVLRPPTRTDYKSYPAITIIPQSSKLPRPQ